MDAADLQSQLEANGELMVKVEEIEEPIELHLHDTEIGEELVTIELSDGRLQFETDRVAASWYHYHSIEEYDLDD